MAWPGMFGAACRAGWLYGVAAYSSFALEQIVQFIKARDAILMQLNACEVKLPATTTPGRAQVA